MRIDPTPSTLVGTTIPTITSRVDPDGARRMMEMLVNLYSDRRLAVAREYVSNAVDATRAAGSTDPVVITTPTPDEPNLIVTDRGTGMSMAEVEETFLAFAASTKRNTNDMVGGLGVGAKSAWALTEAFLIDTIKDGRHTTVRAARNLEHQVLMCDAPSEEPNGTTLIIPVDVDGYQAQWNLAVQEVARAHDPGAVRVDGKPVESIASGPRIGPVLCCKPRQGWNDKFLIRSGGTLFSSVREVNQLLDSTRLVGCVVELPIGSFDHTPSRESVIATKRTLTAVKNALEQYRQDYAALLQRITALAATDVAAAITLRANSLGTVGGRDMLPIPYRIGVPAGAGWLHSTKNSNRLSWKRSDGDDTFAAINTSEELKHTIVITNVPSGKGLSQFAKFVKNHHPDVRRLIAIPQNTLGLDVRDRPGTPTGQIWPISAQTSEIAAHYTFERWSAAVAAERQQYTRGPQCGYTCVINNDGVGGGTYDDTLTGPEIAALGLPVIYIEGEAYEWRQRHVRRVGSIESVTVYLDKRKTGPLIAAIPGAMTPDEWRQRRLDAVMKLPDATLLALVYRSSWCDDYWAAFDVAYLAVIKMLSDDTTHPTRALLSRIAILVGNGRGITKQLDEDLIHLLSTQHDTIQKMYKDLVKAYPLLGSSIKDKNKKHCIDYVIHTPPAGG